MHRGSEIGCWGADLPVKYCVPAHDRPNHDDFIDLLSRTSLRSAPVAALQ